MTRISGSTPRLPRLEEAQRARTQRLLPTALCGLALLAATGCENGPGGRVDSPGGGDPESEGQPPGAPKRKFGERPADSADRPPVQVSDETLTPRGPDAGRGDDRERASVTFTAAPGVQLDARADFEEVSGGVRVRVEVDKGPPGKKGLHVHEKADCSDIPGKSMGSHFNPTGHQHGLPSTPQRHLGDLGNIEIGSNGKGKLEITAPAANLDENDSRSFIGRAIVIHEGEDVGTGPSGDAGKPMACAVIEEASR